MLQSYTSGVTIMLLRHEGQREIRRLFIYNVIINNWQVFI